MSHSWNKHFNRIAPTHWLMHLCLVFFAFILAVICVQLHEWRLSCFACGKWMWIINKCNNGQTTERTHTPIHLQSYKLTCGTCEALGATPLLLFYGGPARRQLAKATSHEWARTSQAQLSVGSKDTHKHTIIQIAECSAAFCSAHFPLHAAGEFNYSLNFQFCIELLLIARFRFCFYFHFKLGCCC